MAVKRRIRPINRGGHIDTEAQRRAAAPPRTSDWADRERPPDRPALPLQCLVHARCHEIFNLDLWR
jgi:hypothetical protein